MLAQQSQTRMADASHAWKHAVTGLIRKIGLVQDAAVRPYRGRRGIAALGGVLNWCCDEAVDSQLVPLVENEKRLKHTMESLVNAHSTLEGDLRHTIGEMRNFSSAVEAAFARVEGANAALSYNISSVYRSWLSQGDVLVHAMELHATLAEALADEAAFAAALGACASNHMSSQLVPIDRLRAAVTSLMTRLSGSRVRLAVTDVATLYTAPLAHCSVTQSQLHIWVKVPLVNIREEWRVVEYVPLPFIWRNTTCQLFPEVVLAARSGDNIAILRGERRPPLPVTVSVPDPARRRLLGAGALHPCCHQRWRCQQPCRRLHLYL